jgi:ankyrin repeat protein
VTPSGAGSAYPREIRTEVFAPLQTAVLALRRLEGSADVEAATVKGLTPLMADAEKGHFEIVAELLRLGASPAKTNGA